MDTMNPMPSESKKSLSKTLGTLLVVGLIALVIIIDMKRRAVQNELERLSMRLQEVTGGNQAENQEAAKKIVAEVRALYELPTDVEPTVATIIDVEALRKQNAFYNKAENGDNLIVTQERAILYRPSKKMIIDVVPVTIQPPAQTQGQVQGGGTAGQPTVAPTQPVTP